MVSKVKKNILKLKESATLAINEKSKKLIKNGKKIYRFGFGQSPFQIPEKIVETLKQNAYKKEYLPIKGLPEIREKISEYLLKKTGVNYDLGRYDLLGKRVKEMNSNINLVELEGLGHLPQIEDFELFYSKLEKVLQN